MNVAPLLAAPLPVWIHLGTVLPSFLIGSWMLLASKKGSAAHRTMGKIYLLLMAATALAALFIAAPPGPGALDLGALRLGPIHLFVPLTVWGIYNAIAGVRTRNIERHRSAMRGMYVGALLIAGILAFLPGRIMHRLVFG